MTVQYVTHTETKCVFHSPIGTHAQHIDFCLERKANTPFTAYSQKGFFNPNSKRKQQRSILIQTSYKFIFDYKKG